MEVVFEERVEEEYRLSRWDRDRERNHHRKKRCWKVVSRHRHWDELSFARRLRHWENRKDRHV